MSLQAKLDTFKADFEGNKAPPEVVAVMHRATAALAASGQAERAKKQGDVAPAFVLPDADGASVDSAALLANWLVDDDIAAGRLVPLFPEYQVTATSLDTAAWLLYPSRAYLPSKVRVTIDFLKSQFR